MSASMLFRRIKKVVEYRDFLEEVLAYEKNQSWSTIRSSLYEQQHTVHIDLRRAHRRLSTQQAREANVDYLDPIAYRFFPKLYAYLEQFAKSEHSTLSRAMIVSLDPHSVVYPHIDVGGYYQKRNRYHLVLQSKGSILTCGNETQIFTDGDLFWFNNKKKHSSKNESDDRRIHVIFDLLPGRSPFILLAQASEKFIARGEPPRIATK